VLLFEVCVYVSEHDNPTWTEPSSVCVASGPVMSAMVINGSSSATGEDAQLICTSSAHDDAQHVLPSLSDVVAWLQRPDAWLQHPGRRVVHVTVLRRRVRSHLCARELRAIATCIACEGSQGNCFTFAGSLLKAAGLIQCDEGGGQPRLHTAERLLAALLHRGAYFVHSRFRLAGRRVEPRGSQATVH
jgi:hypothetical protein